MTSTTSSTTTTTTSRPTGSPFKITAATSRNSFLRTTARTTTTTSTTTVAPEEYEEYEEEAEDEQPSSFKSKTAEEDPKVIKELIDLIRKVGGIEELEKHLLHKEDGTILIKEEQNDGSISTTASPFSKTLYDKVVSRPNAYNSFRNRFAQTSLSRNAGQGKNEQTIEAEEETNDNSKYSSVVRGNSRQGPQNEGLEKLPEFDSFIKEKKQYVTINRNRGGSSKIQNVQQQEESDKEAEELLEEVEDEIKVKPTYASIKRTRPTTTTSTEATDNESLEQSSKTIRKETEKKSYTTLSRTRNRSTTEAALDEPLESSTSR